MLFTENLVRDMDTVPRKHTYTQKQVRILRGVHTMSIQRPFEWSMKHVKIPHFIKCKEKSLLFHLLLITRLDNVE